MSIPDALGVGIVAIYMTCRPVKFSYIRMYLVVDVAKEVGTVVEINYSQLVIERI